MNIKKKLLFICIIIICLIIINNNKFEKFNEFSSTTDKSKAVSTGSDFLDDELFKDVIVYENVIVDNTVKELGFYRCLERCDGHCVEFGDIGYGYCFSNPNKINIDKNLKNNAYTHRDLYN